MRSKSIVIIGALLAAVIIAAAVGFTALQPTPTPTTQLRVGYIPATTYIPVWVADEKGFFEEEGLKVELRGFTSVADLAAALSTGEIDCAPLTSVATVLLTADEAPFTVVGGNSIDGSAIVCRAEDAQKYNSLKDLGGAKLATARYVPGDVIFSYALKENNITVVSTQYMLLSDALRACESRDADLALLWEPYVSLAEARGLTILFWDKDVYDRSYPCCLQVFHDGIVKRNPEAVVKYLRAMRSAADFCRSNPDEAASVALSYIEMPQKILYDSVFYVDPRLGRERNPIIITLSAEDLQTYVNMMVDLKYISQKDASTFLQKLDLSYIR